LRRARRTPAKKERNSKSATRLQEGHREERATGPDREGGTPERPTRSQAGTETAKLKREERAREASRPGGPGRPALDQPSERVPLCERRTRCGFRIHCLCPLAIEAPAPKRLRLYLDFSRRGLPPCISERSFRKLSLPREGICFSGLVLVAPVIGGSRAFLRGSPRGLPGFKVLAKSEGDHSGAYD